MRVSEVPIHLAPASQSSFARDSAPIRPYAGTENDDLLGGGLR